MFAGWEWTARAATSLAHRGEVSRGHSTGGEEGRAGKGRTHERGSLDVLAKEAVMAANPEDGASADGQTVKPDAPAKSGASSQRRTSPDPHPAPAGLFESFLSRENLARALKRVEQNARGPRPGRHEDRGTSSLASRPLARGPRSSRRRHLPTATRPPGVHPQARGQGARPSGCRRCLTVSSSKLSCRCSPRSSTPTSPSRSYGFRPGRSAHQAVRRAKKPSPAVTAGWSISTWKPSSTG